MKDELERNAQFILLHFFDGISDNDYQQLVNESGYALGNDVKEFYMQTNGLQFIYIKKGNRQFSLKDIPGETDYFDWMWPWKDYWQIDGIINILPLQVSLGSNWEQLICFDYQKQIPFHIKGINETLYSYRKRIKPFDFYSKDSVVSFYQSVTNKIEIVIGVENNTEFVQVKKEGFTSYLQFLLDSKAAPEKRMQYKNKRV